MSGSTEDIRLKHQHQKQTKCDFNIHWLVSKEVLLPEVKNVT